MDKAVFSLIGYKFNHVSLNLDNIPSNASFDLEFTPKGEYVQSEGLYNLDFIFKAWEKGEEQSNPKILVNCVASFKFKENISLAEIPNFFYPNSIAILFPYVRAFVSTLTLQANIKPILQAAVAGIESEREVVQYQKFRVLCENQSESYLRALSAGHT